MRHDTRNGPRRHSSWLVWLRVHGLYVAAGVFALGTWRGLAQETPVASASNPAIVAPPAQERVLLLGDSVAATLGESLSALGRDKGVRVFVRGIGDCSLFEGVRPTHNASGQPHSGGNCATQWRADVDEVSPHVTLIVLGGGFLAPVFLDGRWTSSCDKGFPEAYAHELVRHIEEIRPKAGKLALARVPYPVGGWANPTMSRRTDCFNALLEDVAQRVSGALVIDLARQICPTEACTLESEGAPIRPDGLHFQGPGDRAIARWVLDKL